MVLTLVGSLHLAFSEDALVELTFVFLVLMVFQNILVGPFVTDRTTLAGIRAVFEMKTYYLVVLCVTFGVYAFFRPYRFDWKRIISVATVLGLGLGLSALIWSLAAPTGVPMLSRAAYLRDLAMPGVLLLVGQMAVRSSADLGRLVRFLLLVTTVVLVFGFIERVLPGNWLWGRILHADKLWYAKQGVPWQYMLPSETTIFGHRIRRLASTFMDGVNTAFFLGFMIVIVLGFCRRWWRLALFGIVALALLLTLGRGGIVVAICASGVYLLATVRSRLIQILTLTLLLVISVPVGYISIKSAAADHLTGLSSVVRTLPNAPLGHGLGTGGNFAQIAGYTNRPTTLASGGESTLGSIGYQMGLPGLILWFAFLITLVVALITKARNLMAERLPWHHAAYVSAAALLALIGLSVAQESVLSPPANFLYFLIPGALLSALHPAPRADYVAVAASNREKSSPIGAVTVTGLS